MLTTTMSPMQETKYETLLPLLTNTHHIEKDLILKLNKGLFENNSYKSSFQIKPVAHSLPSPAPSPPRSNINIHSSNSSPVRSIEKLITVAAANTPTSSTVNTPSHTKVNSNEIMTIASKIPLFRRRKTNYINKDSKGPIILKLCNVNTLHNQQPATQFPNNSSNSLKLDKINNSSIMSVNSNTPNTPHTIISAKKRRFRCKTCSMAFTTSGHLSRHNKIHTGERNYVCPHETCEQRFSRHDNCLQHYRTHLKKSNRIKK